MSAESLSAQMSDLLKSIAQEQGFGDYDTQVDSGSMKGDGYMGIINTIHLQERLPPRKDLHLIMKSALDSDKLRETAPIRKAYEREIFMYSSVFPELRQFQIDLGASLKFTETPKYYGSLFEEKQESILLENLKEKGFKLWDRKIPMVASHVGKVFETYGKFHGASLAFKNLHPERFEELSKDLINVFYSEDPENMQKFQESTKLIFTNGFRAVAASEKATQALGRFVQKAGTFFSEQIKERDKYSCILHGDCWCNNMMFKYEDLKDSSTPTEVCLLDFQLCHVASPILDLSYFFLTCSAKDALYRLEEFLKIYHDNVSKTLEEAGLKVEDILTFDELLEQWKKYATYGVFMMLFVMRVMVSESDEAPDFGQLADSGKNLLDCISESKSVNDEAANKRIIDVMEFMSDKGYV